jgi:hypothetical protein
MNTMLERLGVPSARNARYFAPGDSFRSITPKTQKAAQLIARFC